MELDIRSCTLYADGTCDSGCGGDSDICAVVGSYERRL